MKTAFVAVVMSLLTGVPPVQAGTMMVFGSTGAAYSVKVTSMKEARFRTTVKQQYDFSCGSAALATLLTYHYQNKVSEQDVFHAMFDIGDQEKIRSQGFSLLDMKKYLETHGYSAAGFHASLDQLVKAGVPAIVLININGYKHFVVVKGVSKDEVLLGDPASGTRIMRRSEFEPIWNGLLFLVRNKKELGQSGFNRQSEWQVRAKAPIGAAVNYSDPSTVGRLLR